MSNSTKIIDYLGAGTHASRPATPPISASALAFYYETDTTFLFVWNGSAWVQVTSQTLLATANPSTSPVTFSSIPAGFSSLRLIGFGRSSLAGTTADNITLQFNGDTGANYEVQNQFSTGSSPSASQATGATSAQCAQLNAAGAVANYPASFDILIPGYANTTFNKTFHSHYTEHTLGSGVANFYDVTLSGAWASTAAINRIDMLTSANWVSGSQVRLYGIP